METYGRPWNLTACALNQSQHKKDCRKLCSVSFPPCACPRLFQLGDRIEKAHKMSQQLLTVIIWTQLLKVCANGIFYNFISVSYKQIVHRSKVEKSCDREIVYHLPYQDRFLLLSARA